MQNVEGLEAPENVVLAEEVFGEDGAKVVGIRLSTRKPLLEGTLIGKQKKKFISAPRYDSKIDLKQTGKLTLKVYDKEYETDVLPIQAPSFKLYEDNPYKVDEWNLFSLQFEAFDSYFRDVSFYNSLVPLATLKPTLIFPMVLFKARSIRLVALNQGILKRL